jgi:hypothetical protein
VASGAPVASKHATTVSRPKPSTARPRSRPVRAGPSSGSSSSRAGSSRAALTSSSMTPPPPPRSTLPMPSTRIESPASIGKASRAILIDSATTSARPARAREPGSPACPTKNPNPAMAMRPPDPARPKKQPAPAARKNPPRLPMNPAHHERGPTHSLSPQEPWARHFDVWTF